MKKRKNVSSGKSRRAKTRHVSSQISGYAESLSFHTKMDQTQKKIQELENKLEKIEERMQDTEIHVNLLTRLLTTICIEKIGMRVGVLKRLIKRIEKEAIRDSQILHLESLYQLPSQSASSPAPEGNKKNPPHPPSKKDDPWDDIA